MNSKTTGLLKKKRKKMLILHDSASVHKSNVVQAVIRKTNFGEVSHPAYSQDIALSDCFC